MRRTKTLDLPNTATALARGGRAALIVLAAAATQAALALEIKLPPPPPIVLPGLPGRVDISRLPLPQVVLPNPVIIAPPRLPVPLPPQPGVVVATPAPPPPRQQPVYMWVPPGHQKNWAKHCHRYQACGVPVYFVRDEWYEQHVKKGARHGRDDDDHPGRGRGEPEGQGNGKGHGQGKGKD
jgi:hypothetical protein